LKFTLVFIALIYIFSIFLKFQFLIFLKKSIFQNFKIQIWKSPNFEIKNRQILNRNQKVDPTAGKSTS
jgi:hypothetical protein